MVMSRLLVSLGGIAVIVAEPTNSAFFNGTRSAFRERRLGSLHCRGEQNQVVECNKAECPSPQAVDCIWKPWSEWQKCTCQGVRKRERRVASPASDGAIGCQGSAEQAEPCVSNCAGTKPRDCELSAWEDWSKCSNSCSGGQRTRSRHFLIQAANTGQPCEGTLSEVQECALMPCVDGVVDCQWGEWSDFSKCTKTCGGGQKTRHRKIAQFPQGTGKLCSPEDFSEIAPCGTGACEAQDDCIFSQWTAWSTCHGVCGAGGFQERKREIKQRAANGGLGCSGKVIDHRPCDVAHHCPSATVDCAFSHWTDFSLCSDMCNGHHSRTRSIEVEARNGGKACAGQMEEVIACNVNVPACEGRGEDCRFSKWSEWSIPAFPSGSHCRDGQSTRERHMRYKASHKAGGGGLPCQGPLREIRQYVADCSKTIDCQWEMWGDWTTCTDACGGGQQSRGRNIAQRNSELGKPCEAGAGLEIRECNTQLCLPPVCGWTDWSEWELPGGSPCGRVQMERQRTKILIDKATGKPIVDTGQFDAVKSCVGTQHEYGMKDLARCTEDCKPRDCSVSPWTVWSPCGCVGLRARRRAIDEYPLCGGAPCAVNLAEEESCQIDESCHGFVASKPCEFSPWTSWSDCSSSCGYGKTVRFRSIAQQAEGMAPECVSARLEEVKKCVKAPCTKPQDCKYSDWNPWSACSKSCDGGQRTRTRGIMQEAKFGGALCKESHLKETEPCKTDPCQGTDCKFSNWGSWSSCSLTCGGGVRSRGRKVAVPSTRKGKPCAGDLQEYEACGTQPCGDGPIDCRLSLWSPWSKCSSDCNGHRSRNRAVVQISRNGGQLCQGPLAEVLPCNVEQPGVNEALPGVGTNLEPCSTQNLDCVFSDWESWSSCRLIESVACGIGQKRRSRSIAQDSQGMGKPCIGELTDLQPCQIDCPDPENCRWGEWGDFSDCSAECGGGQQTRHRAIAVEAFAGGSPCAPAAATEIEPCNTQPCVLPAICGWSPWGDWSPPEGNQECGLAQMYRLRHRVIVDGKTLEPVNPNVVEGKMHANTFSELLNHCNGLQRQREVALVDLGKCGECRPVNCQWSGWSSWSSCSCAGVSLRHRVIKHYPKCGGRLCAGAEEESQTCQSTCIAIVDRHCEYTSWSEWSGCTKMCDGGWQKRIRAVTQLSSGKFAYQKCDAEQDRKCNVGKCPEPRDCLYSPWEKWGPCSVQCGKNGVHMRKRQVAQEPTHGGKLCEAGALEEVGSCDDCRNPDECFTLGEHCLPIDCSLSNWSPWEPCSKQCGGGLQTRHRDITQQPRHGGRPCGGDSGTEKPIMLQEFATCNVEPCEKDRMHCEFGDWNEWTACSKPCNGRRSHTRKIIQDAKAGGMLCTGPIEEIFPCNEGPGVCGAGESVDCELSGWMGWSSCSASCDGGQRIRKRKVLQEPQFKGKPCTGVLAEYGWCNTQPCLAQVDCRWGLWTQWSVCSQPCGGGQRERYRSIQVEPKHGGKACAAQDSHVVAACNTQPCPEPTCIWSDWTAWKMPGAKCGTVTKTRTRRQVLKHNGISETATCHGTQTELGVEDLGACGQCHRQDCVFSSWSQWSACPCNGFRTRHRVIKRFPRCGGDPCSDSTEQGEPCEPECNKQSKECQYSSWTKWSDCDATCGGGKQYRLRSITKHSDEGVCDEKRIEKQACADQPCPEPVDCTYSDWSEWGECSATCDGGFHTRTRRVASEPQNGGAACEAQTLKELKSCNVGLCIEPKDCVLSGWSSWGVCSVTCGGGMQRRTRQVEVQVSGRGKPCDGEMQEFQDCGQGACGEKVDCAFHPWEPWSTCSSPCNGIQHRFREFAAIAQGGGKMCKGAQREVRWPCHLQSTLCDGPRKGEPQDAVVEDWNPWSPCSATCDGGQRTRLRHVLTEATNGGTPATASLKEVEPCGLKPCITKRDCVWGVWEEWTACDRECDGGQSSRHRSIAVEPVGGGAVCQSQAASEIRQCNTEPCKPKLPKGHVCTWGSWEPWSGCDDRCYGQQKRLRHIELGGELDSLCGKLAPMEETRACSHNCGKQKCINARWGRWSDWSKCSCDGLQERHRKVAAFANTCGQPIHGPMKQSKACQPDCIKSMDCKFAKWGPWSHCSQTCEGGQQYRNRKITHHAVGLGKLCDGGMSEVRGCGHLPCHQSSLDCLWGQWKSWSACSSTCGSGEKMRSREILRPHKKGGLPCAAHASLEAAPCNNNWMYGCGGEPTDCKWHPWSDWGRCSASCDGGLHFRTRGREVEQNGGKPCEGRVEDFDTCAAVSCVKKDAAFTLWTEWSACSDPCGGHQERRREFKNWAAEGGRPIKGPLAELRPCEPDPSKKCSDKPIDCELSGWTAWSDCDRDCGGGQEYRSRKVITAGANGGQGCSASLSDVGTCNTEPCPNQFRVDCKWSDWEEWSKCSRECGGGQQQRRKDIMEEPQNGGKPCSGSTSVEVRGCNLELCGVQEYCTWAPWSPYGECSVTCGPGSMRRERHLVVSHEKPVEGFFSVDILSEGPSGPIQNIVDILSMVGFSCFMAGLLVVGIRTCRGYRRTQEPTFVDVGLELEPQYMELPMAGHGESRASAE